MPYQVRFTDSSKSLTIEDQTLNTKTSIALVGKQYLNYASVISENFLHLLENFAYNQPPVNPIQGQLWFDNSPGVNYLKLYDGKNWTETGFVKKSSRQPNNPVYGDLWVDYNNQQLKMYVGTESPDTEWITIGPSLGSRTTGVVVETIQSERVENSMDGDIPSTVVRIISNPVISFYTDNQQIAIISNSDFTPKQSLPGFSTIKKGITLNNLGSTFNGTATQAEALVVDNTVINSSLFLRSDRENIVENKFEIQNDLGLSIGHNLEFNIGVNSELNTTYLKSQATNIAKNINIGFDITSSSIAEFKSIVCIQSTGNVCIGNSSLTPTNTLEVFGNTTIDGNLTIEGNIVVNKIFESPILPNVASSPEINYQNKQIGYLENSPGFLTGVWVGISSGMTSADNFINNNITPSVENIIMVVSENSQVGITSWTSSNNILSTFNSPTFNQSINQYVIDFIGQLTRIRPFIYFYSKNSEIPNETGCSLQTLIVNKAGNIASMSFLSNEGCSAGSGLFLKTTTLYKMSDNIDDFSIIYNDIKLVNDQWLPR